MRLGLERGAVEYSSPGHAALWLETHLGSKSRGSEIPHRIYYLEGGIKGCSIMGRVKAYPPEIY